MEKNERSFELKKINKSEPLVKSSKERGILIHLFFERYFSGHNKKEFRFTERERIFKFSIDIISSYESDYTFSFEKLLKFPLFNFMMSGLTRSYPYTKRRGKKKIPYRDFKTGDRNKENEVVYIFNYMLMPWLALN